MEESTRPVSFKEGEEEQDLINNVGDTTTEGRMVTEGIPLETQGAETKLIEHLETFGFSPKKTDEILTDLAMEAEEGTPLADALHDIIQTDASLTRITRRFDSDRMNSIYDNLKKINDLHTIQGALLARDRTNNNNRETEGPSQGVSGAQGGAGAQETASIQPQTLSPEQIAAHLPTVSGLKDTVSKAGIVLRQPRIVDTPAAAVANVIGSQATLEETIKLATLALPGDANTQARAAIHFATHKAEFERKVADMGALMQKPSDATEGGPLTVRADKLGNITANIRPSLFDLLQSSIPSETEFKLWSAAMFNEEGIHVGQLTALRNEWASRPEATRGDFIAFTELAKAAGVSRKSVFTDRDKVVKAGVAGLLTRDWLGGPIPLVRGAVAEEFAKRLEEGWFTQARDAQKWIQKRTGKTLSESGALKILRRLEGKLKVPRKSHAKKDPAKAAKFKLNPPARLDEVMRASPAQPVRL